MGATTTESRPLLKHSDIEGTGPRGRFHCTPLQGGAARNTCRYLQLQRLKRAKRLLQASSASFDVCDRVASEVGIQALQADPWLSMRTCELALPVLHKAFHPFGGQPQSTPHTRASSISAMERTGYPHVAAAVTDWTRNCRRNGSQVSNARCTGSPSTDCHRHPETQGSVRACGASPAPWLLSMDRCPPRADVPPCCAAGFPRCRPRLLAAPHGAGGQGAMVRSCSGQLMRGMTLGDPYSLPSVAQAKK